MAGHPHDPELTEDEKDAFLEAIGASEPCIGSCGRTTNGWFDDGTHGAGWYCGWCEAVPHPYPQVSGQ